MLPVPSWAISNTILRMSYNCTKCCNNNTNVVTVSNFWRTCLKLHSSDRWPLSPSAPPGSSSLTSSARLDVSIGSPIFLHSFRY